MKPATLVAFTLSLLLSVQCGFAQAPTIVSSSPPFWAVGVPSSTKTVSITFDQPIRPGFDSWIGRSSVLPEVEKEPKLSADLRTSELAVKMAPAHVYVFALNEKGISGVGFQNDHGYSMTKRFLVFQTAGTPAADEMPPRAVSTIPASNAQDVDPSKVKTLSITFDRPMYTEKHGLHMKEAGKPVDLKAAKFQYSPDGKGFSLGYEFKPSTSYEFELNNTEDIGFASAKRIPLWPAKLAFTTGQPH